MTATSPGGVWGHITDLAEGLRERGHHVEVGLSELAERPRNEARERGFAVSTLYKSIDPRVDIWHLQLHNTYDPQAARLLAARRVLGATIATEHLPHFNGSDRTLLAEGARTAITAPIKAALKRVSIATCDAVIIPSESVTQFVRTRYHLHSSSKLYSIPIGVPPQRVAEQIPNEPVGEVIASGGMGIQKGFDMLAEAVRLATVEWPLTILGDGAQRRPLEHQLDGLVGTRVFLPGWQDDPLTWLDRARVACLPSRWETFPAAAIEAHLAGRPVVGFAVDGIPEIVEHEVTGILVEPGDVRGLARALDRIASDYSLALRMGVAGRERALKLFGLSDMLDRTEAVYREVLGL